MGHGKHTEFRVPRLQETIQFDADDLQQTMYETYTLDHPLPTGVKVMSCLFRHSSMLGRVPVNP
jgi:hypothetical protein